MMRPLAVTDAEKNAERAAALAWALADKLREERNTLRGLYGGEHDDT
jgi:hypothetical protein